MKNRRALGFILATIFLDAVGVGIVFPLMPDLMARVGADTTAEGAFWGGILMAAYAAMQFLFAPVIGGFSDAAGRRPVLLLALAALSVDYAIMAMAGTLWLLLLGRTLAGIAGATHIAATAYLADISTPEKRAANFGLIGATYGVGFIMGPVLGGLAAGIHITAPFWIAAGLAALNFLFGLFALPESLPAESRRRFSRADMNPFAAILQALRLPGVALPLGCLFVFEFANMVYPTLWAFWSREVFGWNAAMIGATLAAYGLGVAVTQGILLRLLVPRIGEYRALVFGVLCSILAYLGFGLTGAAWAVFIFLPISTLSDMVPPTMTAVMSNRVAEDRQGLLQGVIASLGSIAAVIAPLIVTGAFRYFAEPGSGHYLPGAPFLMSGLLVAAVLPFILRLARGGQAGPQA